MNRATLANWVLAVHRDYFAPLWKHMKTELLKSSVIHCDGTTVQVLKEPGKVPASESYMWAYRSGEHEAKQIVLFDYQPGRSGDYAKKFLEGYKGCFVTDGYAGYNKVTGRNPLRLMGACAKESFEFCEKLSQVFLRQNGGCNEKNEADLCRKHSGHGAAALTRCGIRH